MALLPQNPRSQKLLLLTIAALALGGAYWQLLWTPQHTELNALEARLDTLDSLNRIAKREVAKGNAAKMRAEADAYGRELLMLRHLVPTETEVPALVESVSSA